MNACLRSDWWYYTRPLFISRSMLFMYYYYHFYYYYIIRIIRVIPFVILLYLGIFFFFFSSFVPFGFRLIAFTFILIPDVEYSPGSHSCFLFRHSILFGMVCRQNFILFYVFFSSCWYVLLMCICHHHHHHRLCCHRYVRHQNISTQLSLLHFNLTLLCNARTIRMSVINNLKTTTKTKTKQDNKYTQRQTHSYTHISHDYWLMPL